ncbi:MAG: DUF3267 domain-containing protein [Ruminococcus sp.]|nr:DUF3267 domain-containing protein [Ruminococcus sp.]
MKLHYKGKFDGNPESLPCREHMPGAVKFKEAKDAKTLAVIANVLAFLLLIPLLILLGLRCGWDSLIYCGPSGLLSVLILFPHEILHAVCFREDVCLYTNFKQGMLFVVGTETMSKARFIFMSLCPNLVFGIIPFLLAMIFPSLSFLGAFGALCTIMGAGDYYNIFNALTQMPKGARTYLYQFNSYWYLPEDAAKNGGCGI